MLQRSGFPASTAPEVASELNPTLARTVQRGWRRLALPLAWLPETWPQFFTLLAIVLGIAAGLAVQIYQSVEIAHAQVELRGLRAEYERIERQNADLIFAIASKTALNRIYAEAERQGFVPATGRVYVRPDLLTESTAPVPGTAAPVSQMIPAAQAADGAAAISAGPVGAPAAGGWQEQLTEAVRGLARASTCGDAVCRARRRPRHSSGSTTSWDGRRMTAAFPDPGGEHPQALGEPTTPPPESIQKRELWRFWMLVFLLVALTAAVLVPLLMHQAFRLGVVEAAGLPHLGQSPRGSIVDWFGALLAADRYSYEVSTTPAHFHDDEGAFRRWRRVWRNWRASPRPRPCASCRRTTTAGSASMCGWRLPSVWKQARKSWTSRIHWRRMTVLLRCWMCSSRRPANGTTRRERWPPISWACLPAPKNPPG